MDVGMSKGVLDAAPQVRLHLPLLPALPGWVVIFEFSITTVRSSYVQQGTST